MQERLYVAVFVPTKTEECVQRLAASNVSIQAPGEAEGSILETVPVDLGGGLPAISYIQIYSSSSSLLTCRRHVLLSIIFSVSEVKANVRITECAIHHFPSDKD